MAKLYPDISHWHPVEDWEVVAKNASTLISKATQGTAYIDPTLDSFIEGCEEHAITYWLYAYLNKGQELAQTKFLVNVCRNKVGSHFLGYALDAEANNTVDNVKIALDWLTRQGKPVMLYVGWGDYDMYSQILKSLGAVQWWEARYGPDNGKYNPAYPCHDGVNLHQYTSNGVCPGIPGLVDLNRTVVYEAPSVAAPAKTGKAYSGTWPVFPDGRDCYRQGDGIVRLTNYPTQLKRVQKLLRWITGERLTIDGKYGPKTSEACRRAQEAIGANPDGIFGPQTLRRAKEFRK